MTESLRQRVKRGDPFLGTFINLGSCVTAEMAAYSGFDWLLIDAEHGLTDYQTLLHQLQAIRGSSTVPIVRIVWNDATEMKRVLDLGPAGLMVPMINTPEEAVAAARGISYPPAGVRGVAKMNRAAGFGHTFGEYFATQANDLLLVAQIETPGAVENAENIAAIDRVDVLFVGPTDLSVNMGILDQIDHPKFTEALRRIADAARKAGKSAGILAPTPEKAREYLQLGFTFLASGSDSSIVAGGLRGLAKSLNSIKSNG